MDRDRLFQSASATEQSPGDHRFARPHLCQWRRSASHDNFHSSQLFTNRSDTRL